MSKEHVDFDNQLDEPGLGTEEVEKSTNTSSSSSSTSSSALCTAGTVTEAQLSKRQLRKLKKQEKWLLIKAEKRAKEKEKKKQKKREAMAKGENLGPSRKRLKDNTMEKSECKVIAVIDCGFDSYMSEKDIMKLTKQIQFCYSTNRRADNPLQYYVTGVHGQMKGRLQRIGDYVNWDVNFSEKNYFEIFKKEEIVYLSSDSPNVLNDLDPGKAYIIGGLVDHNHHKGLCHQLAEERGVSHAQLPLTEYLDMKTRKVLTINHVFDILLRYTETKDWKEAFFTVLPQRKGAKLKSDIPDSKSSSGEENENHEDDDNDAGDEDNKVDIIDDEASSDKQTSATEIASSIDSQCSVSTPGNDNFVCEDSSVNSDNIVLLSESVKSESYNVTEGTSIDDTRTQNCLEEKS